MDQQDARDIIQHLAETIGPRPAGSANDHEAAEWVASEFEARGYEVSVEPFRCPGAFAPLFFVLTVLSIAGVGLAYLSPTVGIGLTAFAFLAFVIEAMGVELVSRLMPQVTTQNVVAQRRCEGEATGRLIVTAHLDSAYAGLAFRPRMVRFLRIVFLGIAGAMALLAGVTIASVILGPWILLVGVKAAAYLVFALVLLGHQWFVAKPSPGAGDNAAGVAAMLMVAGELPKLQGFDLVCVATGAEEAGLYGMARLLASRDFDKANDLFLNIDNVGGGPLRLIAREGILLPLHADERMLMAGVAAVAKLHLEVRVGSYRTLPVESAAALMRGYRAMTVMGQLDNWHQETDTADRVDTQVTTQAAELCREIIIRLDQAWTESSPHPEEGQECAS